MAYTLCVVFNICRFLFPNFDVHAYKTKNMFSDFEHHFYTYWGVRITSMTYNEDYLYNNSWNIFECLRLA